MEGWSVGGMANRDTFPITPALYYSIRPRILPCAHRGSPPVCPVMSEGRKLGLGCLTIFLAVALCASVFINLISAVSGFRRFGSGPKFEEPSPTFREVIVQRGTRG